MKRTLRLVRVLQVSFLHLAEDEREVGIPEGMHYDAPVRCMARPHYLASSFQKGCEDMLLH